MPKTQLYDTAEFLETDEDIRYYLEAAFEGGDKPHIVRAIGIAARAKGMTVIAAETGLSRESLYKALTDDANPSFDTIHRVLKAMGVRLDVKASRPARRKRRVLADAAE